MWRVASPIAASAECAIFWKPVALKDHGPYVDRLLDAGHTPTDIASALFHLLSKEEAREGESILEDNEPYSEKASHAGRGGKSGNNKRFGGKKRRWDERSNQGSPRNFKKKAYGASKSGAADAKSSQRARRFKRPDA
jgi:ATP-dependent RNA helicase DeaD